MQVVSDCLDYIRKSWIEKEHVRIANNPMINALEYTKVRYKSLVCLRELRLLKPREDTCAGSFEGFTFVLMQNNNILKMVRRHVMLENCFSSSYTNVYMNAVYFSRLN